jgi:hypothetical protein
MSVTKVVRYTTKPEHAEENVRLIRKVFAALAELEPGGIHAAFRLDDGVSFVRRGARTAERFRWQVGGVRPVPGHRRAMRRGPVAADAAVVGSYRMPVE